MLIIISPDIPITSLEVAQTAHIASSGLVRYHLRKPKSSEKELAAFLEQMPADALSHIVLHQHYDLVQRFAIGGIHLPTRERERLSYFEQFVGKLLISTSFHSFDEIQQTDFQFSYGFLSPIYDSISKQSYNSVFTESDLRSFLTSRQKKLPLVALGGISLENMHTTLDMGFAGVAFLGTVWQAPNPVAMFDSIAEQYSKSLASITK